MASDGSITRLIVLLKDGDRDAAQPLWDAYFRRLVGLARARLRGTPRGMADEEDVALSAFDSFCRRAERGDFPQLADRDDLWQLLFVLTVRKAIGLARHQGRARLSSPATFVQNSRCLLVVCSCHVSLFAFQCSSTVGRWEPGVHR